MTTHSILVTGDFVVDQHIYEGQRQHYGDGRSRGAHIVQELGGAALVHKLLDELLRLHAEQQGKNTAGKGANTVHPRKLPWHPMLPFKPAKNLWAHFEQSFAVWRPCPQGNDKKMAQPVWRVREAMGFGCKQKAPLEGQATADPIAPLLQQAQEEAPRIVILSEGGMGFRDKKDYWPNEETLAAAEWIILKTTAPLAQGKLWKDLSGQFAEKLIVLVSAHELRKSPGVRISTGLSWEETLEGLLHELGSNGCLKDLSQCRHLVVSFEAEGAIWFNLPQQGTIAAAEACLVYAAGTIEGEQSHGCEGSSFGFVSCLTAAVAWFLMLAIEAETASVAPPGDVPDFPLALARGLSAMHDLLERGHGPVTDEQATGFPAARLAEIILQTTMRYSRAWLLPKELTFLTQGTVPGWSLVQWAQNGDGPVYDLANLVLLRGPIALASLPHLKVGNMLTADRREIESLRTLTQVIRRYEGQKKSKKPLSIGVFGPPGAGKSFAVREISKALVQDLAWLEFNLSQFSSPDELNGAFHQIRDQVLQHKLPVAFFDEFDAREYEWLQYLLAPMQDGKFQDGQLLHTLGKCIFVFAGGTSPTFETFGPPKAIGTAPETEVQRQFRLAKGPDFKSRIDAFLNVLGPNQRRIPLEEGEEATQPVEKIGGRDFVIDPTDIIFPLRRALITRVQLGCIPDDKLDIEPGLAHALLHVGTFEHGNRSLEKVLTPLATGRPGTIHRSLLMPQIQLAMHTDAEEFLGLCKGAPKPFQADNPLSQTQIDYIAPVIHQIYREKSRKEGWSKKETDKDYLDLSPFYRESNREAAKRMLSHLLRVGLQLEEGVATVEEEKEMIQHLEYYLLGLADEEHEDWMAWYFSQGWTYGKERDETNCKHPCLVPFSRLKDNEQDKDRATIRMYPYFARVAGMKIGFIMK